LYYGRILTTGVSAIESSYVDYVENDVIAGFATVPDVDGYARIPIDRERIVFNIDDDRIPGSQARIPGFFTMLGGPACGPDALVSIIKHYNWSKVVLYFQNDPAVVVLSEAFVSIALFHSIDFDLQKRESAGAGAAEVDLSDLQAAKSNVFVFFGGKLLRSREAALCFAAPCGPNSAGMKARSAGHGCFNDRATRLVRSRPEIAIICCCALPHSGPLCPHPVASLHLHNLLTHVPCSAPYGCHAVMQHAWWDAGGPQMMVPTSTNSFPEGIMNVHDAT
jgi:hypothetical protein